MYAGFYLRMDSLFQKTDSKHFDAVHLTWTDDSRLASSMENVFSTLDPVLQSITDPVKTFSTILTEEMAKELSNRPNISATTEDPYLDGIYLWLEHILTSETWKQHIHFLCSTAYLRFICDEWSNHWTDMLAKIIGHVETSQVYDSLSTQSVPSIDGSVGPALAGDLEASGWSY